LAFLAGHHDERRHCHHPRAVPILVRTAQRLHHDQGWFQALASSAPRANIEVILAVLGTAHCFQGIVSAEHVRKGKPDPEVYLVAASRVGVYEGISDRSLARMAIALRMPDYGKMLPQMLRKLDDANRGNPHYLGWALHSYNDYLNLDQSNKNDGHVKLIGADEGT
jgi:hypothetical protein